MTQRSTPTKSTSARSAKPTKQTTRAPAAKGRPNAKPSKSSSGGQARKATHPTHPNKAKRSRKAEAPAQGPAASAPRQQRLPMYTAPKSGRGRRKASCTACGLCCSYVAIEVDSPATVKEATQLLWYVYHEGVSLYDNDDEWMVQFDTTCVYLQPDYRCGIYETRPHICREFSEQDCEVNTGDDGRTFYNATEFLDHLRETRPRIYARVMKGFAPPAEPPRARLAPFEHRFQAVMARREALGV